MQALSRTTDLLCEVMTVDRVTRSRGRTAMLLVPAMVLSINLMSDRSAWGGAFDGLSPHRKQDAARQSSVPPSPIPLAPSNSMPFRNPNVSLGWGPMFKAQLERCWKRPPYEGRIAIEVIFAIRLKRDGMLESVRIISSIDETPFGKAYQTSGFRAIMDCQPYRLPEASYDEWKHFEPVFTERNLRPGS